MKFEKTKELHDDALLKIKVQNKEIDKIDRIINDFIDNMNIKSYLIMKINY